MQNLIRTLKRWIGQGSRTGEAGYSPDILRKVAQQVEMTQEVEYSCDDVFAVLDVFVEAVLRGEPLTDALLLVQRHLEMCRDCREEYEALMQVMKASLT